jgi:hypothetical protein
MISLRNVSFVGICLAVVSCAGEASPTSETRSAVDAIQTGTSVEVAEFDVSENGIDRFLNCPPPGELGQDWIPPLPSWTPPASTEGSVGASGEATRDATADAIPDATMHGSTPTEKAIADTRDSFRACYNHGLIYDPTQDGHVAIVLRVGRDGRVASVESWGACEIASQSIECMRDAAKKLRFRPPVGGSDTVTIPAVFTSSGTERRTSPRPNDVYAASAYIAVEAVRQEFHACERGERQSGGPVSATATFALDLDATGRVLHSNIDPWTGDKNLLACAAGAFGRAPFPPPPGGHGSVLVRVAFNPRAGSK